MRISGYSTIGPAGLERNLGVWGAILGRGFKGSIGMTDDGEPYLISDNHGKHIPIEHGQIIRLSLNRASDKGNYLRDYIFVDESD